MSLRRLALVVALFLPLAASGQGFRGVIRDSASGVPIPGVVVMAYGENRVVLARVLSDDQGRWGMFPSAQPMSLRATRIGFRPREVVVSAGQSQIDISLATIPTLLEQVQVVSSASACPVRSDRVRTAGLLDQARTALLATVVAREAQPATVTRIRFERRLDANGTRIESQTVRLETADRATVSFNAAQAPVDFTQRGFVLTDDGRRTYYGPDADVLLDDAFGRAYCFRIADPDRTRPQLVGLGFTPARRQDGRTDIDGTLWVDTVARRLSHTEFKYVGLDELSEGLGAGGTVSFREVAPSITLIDRWTLRVIGGRGPDLFNQASSQFYSVGEIGGELAIARWDSVRSWSASLGTLRVTGTQSGGAVSVGTRLALLGTDYEATTDSAGRAEFAALVPGPYRLAVLDSKLATIGLDIPTELSFIAARDSVHSSKVQLPTAQEFASNFCGPGSTRTSAWLIGRVGTSAGAPVDDAKWSVARSSKNGWERVVEGGAQGGGGLFAHCRNLKLGETVQVRAWRGRESPAVSVRVLSDQLTILPVKLPTAVARGRGATTTLRGVVRDSTANAPVPGAFVELSGTKFSAITDSSGAFSIDGIAPGEYTAEIRTDALDALGAVGRSTFDFGTTGAPVRLYVPAQRELLGAMCGPGMPASVGVVVGAFTSESGALPKGLRAVAEWRERSTNAADSVPRLNWVRARAEADGRFRICGVPLGSALTVRTQTDSGETLAGRPMLTRLASGQSLTTTAIPLQAGLKVGAAYSGTVVSDSTGDLVADAEVVFDSLKRAVKTTADGTFRINDIPAGAHRITIRRGGYRPISAEVTFTENQTIDHRIVLVQAAAALPTVQVTEGASVNSSFDEHRKLGVGKFLTRDDLDKHPGSTLGTVLSSTPTMNFTGVGGGNHAWLTGRRIPVKLGPAKFEMPANFSVGGFDFGEGAERRIRESPEAQKQFCVKPDDSSLGCSISMDDMRDVGYYCPKGGEGSSGIRCACYAQVYVDGRLMNRERPTEPFDINTVNADDIEGVEWYSSPSQTPARYSSLNSPCGVMAIWTRKSRGFDVSQLNR